MKWIVLLSTAEDFHRSKFTRLPWIAGLSLRIDFYSTSKKFRFNLYPCPSAYTTNTAGRIGIHEKIIYEMKYIVKGLDSKASKYMKNIRLAAKRFFFYNPNTAKHIIPCCFNVDLPRMHEIYWNVYLYTRIFPPVFSDFYKNICHGDKWTC